MISRILWWGVSRAFRVPEISEDMVDALVAAIIEEAAAA